MKQGNLEMAWSLCVTSDSLRNKWQTYNLLLINLEKNKVVIFIKSYLHTTKWASIFVQ